MGAATAAAVDPQERSGKSFSPFGANSAIGNIRGGDDSRFGDLFDHIQQIGGAEMIDGRVSRAAVAQWLRSDEVIQQMLGIVRPDSPVIARVMADIEFEAGNGVDKRDFAAFMRGCLERSQGGAGERDAGETGARVHGCGPSNSSDNHDGAPNVPTGEADEASLGTLSELLSSRAAEVAECDGFNAYAETAARWPSPIGLVSGGELTPFRQSSHSPNGRTAELLTFTSPGFEQSPVPLAPSPGPGGFILLPNLSAAAWSVIVIHV
eukprot:SAG11_NODE_361_length_10183_cov_4.077053_9_plen_265_part_00